MEHYANSVDSDQMERSANNVNTVNSVDADQMACSANSAD